MESSNRTRKNASKRTKIITEIVSQLSLEEWNIVDLTLRQFGLPWTDNWNGEKKEYVVAMIEDATDDQLYELANHLNIAGYANTKSHLSRIPVKELIKQVEAQKALMISVATGGARIQTVDDEYRERRLELSSSLIELGIQDPNSYSDLWNWYDKWSDGSLPTYQSRRQYISALYQPLLDSLSSKLHLGELQSAKEPTGWERVDRNVDKIVAQLAEAKDEEDFQAVGLLCREALISVAQAVYDPKAHPPLDGVSISETDANRMIESYIANKLAGSSNEIHRKFAKTAYQLAVGLQHRRTAKFRDAALCIEATRSVINTIAIISGQRDP
jgi:hypothetical protein